MKTIPSLISAGLLFFAFSASAQEPPAKQDVPPPPPITDEEFEEQARVQADVTIRKGKDKVIEEYRVNGKLYMVKVTPKVGKPYYLRYPEGEGGRVIQHELRDINTPYWKLFEW